MKKHKKQTTRSSLKGDVRGVFNRRIFFILSFLVFIFILLICRLLYIQIFESEELTKQALNQLTKKESINSNRGLIYDTNKKVLALNVSKSTVYYDSSKITPEGGKRQKKKETDESYNMRMEHFNQTRKKKLEDDARYLSNLLNLDEQETLLNISKNKKVVVAKDVERKIALELREKQDPCISFEDYIKRFYPFGHSMSHVLGFLDNENYGLYGLERQFDDELVGIKGKSIKIKDEQLRQIPMTDEMQYAPQDGLDLITTMDINIQQFADKAAEECKNTTNAEKVSIIVQNTETGEILAMVNKEDYDPNSPREPINEKQKKEWVTLSQDEMVRIWSDNWKNFAVESQYEPGSTFKLITAASALEEDTTNPQKTYSCPGVLTDMKGVKITCTSPNRGTKTMEKAVEESCNISFVKIGRELGAEKFLKFIKAFGFGEKTGIDLKGEVKGTIPKDPSTISKVGISTMSYGHGIAVTPIQLINAVSAIGNGGFLNKPLIAKEIVDKDGNVIEKFKKVTYRRVISQETSNTMKDLMRLVVDEGTGKKAQVPGYKVGGKTGTAYIASSSGGYENEYNASFVALAPAKDPVITVLVIVEKPEGDFFGATVAAPVAGAVIKDTLDYLKVPKTENFDENTEKESVVVPDITGRLVMDAGKIIVDSNLKFASVKGDIDVSSVVVSQNPKAGTTVKAGSIVDITVNSKTEKMVPNLIGKNKEDARKLLENLKIKYKIEGEGYVINQSIKPGTIMTDEMILVIKTDKDLDKVENSVVNPDNEENHNNHKHEENKNENKNEK